MKTQLNKLKEKSVKAISLNIKKMASFFEKIYRNFKYNQDFFEQSSKIQKKLHDENCKKNQKPKNFDILLKNITVNVVFQREEFTVLCSLLERLLPEGQRKKEIINNIKSNDFYSMSWQNIGALSPTMRDSLEDLGFAKASLPKGCDYLKIQFHRPLPSLAYLSLSFDVNDSINNKLDSAHRDTEFAPQKFNYLRAILKKGYSIKGYDHYFSQSKVQHTVEVFYLEIASWINKQAKSHLDRLGCLLYYAVKGTTSPQSDWFSNNLSWLHVYNVNIVHSESYFSDDSYIFCFPQSEKQTSFFIQASEFDNNKDIDELGVSIAIDTIVALEEELKFLNSKIDDLIGSGFIQLGKIDKSSVGHTEKIIEIKKYKILIQRFSQEFEKHSSFLSHTVSSLEKYKSNQNDVALSDDWLQGFQFRLHLTREKIEMADSGIRDVLETKNISINHKLQRKIFWLSIIVTIAIIIGLLANLNGILDGLATIYSFLKSAFFRTTI